MNSTSVKETNKNPPQASWLVRWRHKYHFVIWFIFVWFCTLVCARKNPSLHPCDIYIFLYSWKKMIWRNMSRVRAHYYDLFMVKVNKNPKNIRLLSFPSFQPRNKHLNGAFVPPCFRRPPNSFPKLDWRPQKNTRRWGQTCTFCRRSCEPTDQNRAELGDLQTWGSTASTTGVILPPHGPLVNTHRHHPYCVLMPPAGLRRANKPTFVEAALNETFIFLSFFFFGQTSPHWPHSANLHPTRTHTHTHAQYPPHGSHTLCSI